MATSKLHTEFCGSLTLFILGFFGWCSTGEVCFPPPPCNSFLFQVRRLKFCTELLWGRINILGKKNRDQIDNDVTMTSSLLDEYRKLLKTAYFKITAASYTSLNLIKIWQVYLTLILLYLQKVIFDIINVSWF